MSLRCYNITTGSLALPTDLRRTMPISMQYFMYFMMLFLFLEKCSALISGHLVSKRARKLEASFAEASRMLRESEEEAVVQADLLLSGELGEKVKSHLDKMMEKPNSNPLEVMLYGAQIETAVKLVIANALSSSAQRQRMAIYESVADTAESRKQLLDMQSAIDNNLENAKALLVSAGIDPETLARQFS